ncbi:MAG TPA: penicillin-binding protein 2 [Caulobacteraceae bacterium]|jgi:penicillin-binding protein 2
MTDSVNFSDVNERQGAFHRRTFVLGGLTGLGIAVLGGRLAQLQLLQTEKYRMASAENQFQDRLIPAPRGRILDRFGIELAASRPNFRVTVSRDDLDDVEKTLDVIGELLPGTVARREQLLRQIKTSPRSMPVSLADDLTWDEFSRITVRAPELPGVIADMNEARVYPFGGAFAHSVGYVAKVSDRDIQKIKEKTGQEPERIYLHPGFRIGKMGVEKALDEDLRGKAGAQKAEVTAEGRVIRINHAASTEAVPGKDVVLTLDADVQQRAIEVFGPESGSAVVMDIRNGDILCMASSPAFDPNKFVSGVPGREYRLLNEYERKPLLDKAITGTYAPGSTFKMVTGLAGLRKGIPPERRYTCTGGFYFGRRFACHSTHGPQDLHAAIKNSCDVYFYNVALEVGPDAIAEVAKELGFGQTFDIGIDGQKPGIVPSTAWKREYYKNHPHPDMRKWWPGESPSYGIGQGALAVNALQLAVYTSRLANGRKKIMPRLIRSVGGVERPSGADVPDLPFAKDHLERVRGGMAAVTDIGGTGYRNSQLGLGPLKMAGKTGTAQVRNYGAGSRKSTGVQWSLRDHGLFVAFAPLDQPRYAISVIVQHGQGGGLAAAPRAREIMKVVLLKDPEMRKRMMGPPEMQVAST